MGQSMTPPLLTQPLLGPLVHELDVAHSDTETFPVVPFQSNGAIVFSRAHAVAPEEL
jgi:hypothetical protein